ncbi:MAG: hypothetical protein M3N57_12735 [Actinomycetota bacterium]|nr:hypothetical protein [Actinomycetota bacterium]
MSTLQAWLIVGIPGLVIAAALFAGRSPVRAAFGYLALAILFGFLLLVPRSPMSAAFVGTIGFLLVAAGRGETAVETQPAARDVPMRVDDPDVDQPERV